MNHLTPRIARTIPLIAFAAFATAALAQQKPLPLKYKGPATNADITAGDLMTRLYIFADDSMMGRRIGDEGNNKGAAYIEREVRKLGLKPAGDSGGFFQNVPVYRHSFDPASTITVGGATFKGGIDFIVSGQATQPLQLAETQVVYGGVQGDTTNLLQNDAVRGKVVLARPAAGGGRGFPGGGGRGRGAVSPFVTSMAGAIMVTIGGDVLPPAAVRNALYPNVRYGAPAAPGGGAQGAAAITVTTRLAEALLGAPLASATKGQTGKSMSAKFNFIDTPVLARNVVAILPGSDPALRNEYVAIGGHNDHVGFNLAPVDHDSIRAYNQVVRPEGADSPANVQPTSDQWARIRAITDSLHKLHPARTDSIFNGADDDGSGSVSVLEIAEAFARGTVKPKRSIIFVWHNGEEAGLWGAQYFTDNPTVPRDAIVAQLNMDMVGRGAATDVTGHTKDNKPIVGGPNYLQLVGSRRLSSELGDIVEAVNTDKKIGVVFDYSMDENGHPQNIYCRSDHYEYARYGIPIVFFNTGGHADYHQVTDEPQYIDYDRMAQVNRLVFETAMKVANLDHRVAVDKPKPDPRGRCVQ